MSCLPAGVVVSMASWRDRNPPPRSWSEFTTSIRSRRERPRRSSFHTTTTSPLRANARSFSLAGRVVRVPESFSNLGIRFLVDAFARPQHLVAT